MDSFLSRYLSAPYISIINAAKVLSGIDPNLCLVDFDRGLSEPVGNHPDAEYRAQISKAQDLSLLLKCDVTKADTILNVVSLVAYPIPLDSILYKYELNYCYDTLVKNHFSLTHIDSYPFPNYYDRVDVFNGGDHELIVSVKNPTNEIRTSVFSTNDWSISDKTALTTRSLIEWASKLGISQIVPESEPLMESDTVDYQEENLPELFAHILNINSDFIPDDVMIMLNAQLYLFEHGSNGSNTKQALVDYLHKRHSIQPGSNKSERISMLLHPTSSSAGKKKGAAVIMPTLKDYLLEKNKPSEKITKPRTEKSLIDQFLLDK